MKEQELIRIGTAEAYLGECKKRYFSSSYKKMRFSFDDFLISNGKIVGVLNVTYPKVWAVKMAAHSFHT